MTSRITPSQRHACPRCGDPLLPIVYGMPDGALIAAADRGEVVLGGCIVGFAEVACTVCGWRDDPAAEDTYIDFLDGDDVYDNLPTDTVSLAGLTIAQAERVEERADRVATMGALADGLHAAVRGGELDLRWLTPAERFAATVAAAADRAADAAAMARRAIGRVLDLCEGADDDDRSDDWLYERVLTARLHVPIATSLLSDALGDATPALRHLARLALAASLEGDGDSQLERHARGVLRLDLPGLDEPLLAAEQPELWSVTLDELRLEVAGLLANLLVDHRTYFILANENRDNRFVQVLTYDRGLHMESVGDAFLDVHEKLTDAEQARLAELGWTPPDGEPPNWHRAWDDHVDVHAVADLLVDTLVDVHGLDLVDDLDLTIAETVDPFADQPPETT